MRNAGSSRWLEYLSLFDYQSIRYVLVGLSTPSPFSIWRTPTFSSPHKRILHRTTKEISDSGHSPPAFHTSARLNRGDVARGLFSIDNNRYLCKPGSIWIPELWSHMTWLIPNRHAVISKRPRYFYAHEKFSQNDWNSYNLIVLCGAQFLNGSHLWCHKPYVSGINCWKLKINN